MHRYFDGLGVVGVYKVMKAERLSHKSLTEGVALSLAEFDLKFDGIHECTLDVSFLSLVGSYSKGGYEFLLSADEHCDD